MIEIQIGAARAVQDMFQKSSDVYPAQTEADNELQPIYNVNPK